MYSKNIYLKYFVIISCSLFSLFFIRLLLDPNGIQRQIFFMGMNDFFADFFNMLRYTATRDPYFTGPQEHVNYFPLSFLLIYPFSRLDNFNDMSLQETWNSKFGMMSAFIYTLMSILLFLLSINFIRKKNNLSPIIFISLIFSSIFFFTIERGNTIILSAAFISIFIAFYDSDNKNERLLAILSIAIASTLKVYPVLFGILYLEKKQYKEIIYSAIITLLLIFFPFLFFLRGFNNIPRLIDNFNIHNQNYNFSSVYPRFNITHCVFYLLKTVNIKEYTLISITNFIKFFIYFLSLISITISIFITNKWYKISLITMVVVFFPTNSALYCGLYIFPMIILFFATMKERPVFINIIILIIFIIFLNPYQYNIYIFNYNLNNYLTSNIAFLFLWFYLVIYSILILDINIFIKKLYINIKNRIVLLNFLNKK